MTSRPICPECATPVEVDWEWCHGCGFDPEGKLAEARAQGLEPALSAAPPAGTGSAFPGAAPPGPVNDLPPPPPPPPPASPSSPLPPPDSWADDWGAELLAEPTDAVPVEPAVTPVGETAFDDTFGETTFDQPFDAAGSEPDIGVGEPWDAVPPSTGTAFPSAAFPSPAFPNAADGPPSAGDEDDGFEQYADANERVPAGPVLDAGFVAPPPSTFLAEVPAAHHDSGVPAEPETPAPAQPEPPADGFAPTGWQNDPPPKTPAGALNPKAGAPKTPVLIALGVIVVVVIGFVFVKMGSNDRQKPADRPNGPPPAGSVALNTTPSTAPPITVAPGWIAYRSADGRYLAGFPIAPNQRNVTVTVGDRTLSAVEVNAQEGPAAPAFAVDTIEVPAGFAVPDAQTAFDLLAQHFEVISSEPYSANGLDGVRFTARRNGADLTGLVYVRGGRIYYLVAGGADPTAFDQFASSFQLLGK